MTRMGCVQLLCAIVLGVLAWLAPSGDDVAADLRHAETLTRAAGEHLAPANGTRFKQQRAVAALDDPRSEEITDLEQLRDSLEAVSQGLRTLAVAFDPRPPKQLGKGLGEAADYLDRQLVPTAEQAARELEAASDLLQTDTLRLAELLRAAPLDLEAIQHVHDALGKFAAGTEALHRMLELSRLVEIRGGLQGLDASLTAAAEQVDQLSGYTYPVMRVNGWKPAIDYKLFWPNGERIAGGLQQAAGGVKAADKELEAMNRELPKVRAAVDSSRQILEKSRDTLGVVLKHRDKIEPLVKSLPETAARLAEDLPKLTKQFSATLRDTQRLKQMAKGLRKTQAHLDQSVAGWPEVQGTLLSAADAIAARRRQLDEVVRAQQAWGSQSQEQAAVEHARADQLKDNLEAIANTQAGQARSLSQWFTALRWGLILMAAGLALAGVSPLSRPRAYWPRQH